MSARDDYPTRNMHDDDDYIRALDEIDQLRAMVAYSDALNRGRNRPAR